MSKKHKPVPEQPRKKKRSTSVVAVVGTVALILALIGVLTYQPSRTSVSTPSTPQTSQPSPYEFVKQGELRFMTAKQNFITAIDIELAQDEADRQLGLMYRDNMAENQGMLFVFEDETVRSFWMKNTVLSLDMLFVNGKNEIVTIHKSTTPYSEESYSSTKPAKYVVEVNAGFTDRHKIAVGDCISWRRF